MTFVLDASIAAVWFLPEARSRCGNPLPTAFRPGSPPCVALAASIGLVAQFAAQISRTPEAFTALWALLRYFTILTNGLVAVVFLRAAFRPVNATLLNGTILFILLVGVVNLVMLGPPNARHPG